MKKILLISDTHGYLDETILKYVKDSDITIHAGDVGNEKLIKTIRKHTVFIGVYGNIDTVSYTHLTLPTIYSV